MAQKLKLIGPGLALMLLAACVSQPPAPRERVVPRGEPAPVERPLPPPVRQSEPTTVPVPAPAAPAAPYEIPAPAAAPTQPRAAAPALPAAAKNLVAKAGEASAAGRHDEAAAYLERALRIAPRQAALWQNLAVIRYRQHDYDQVEGLALKSNSLGASDLSLQRANWELISTVRRLKGDRSGAAVAATEARRLTAQ